MNISSLLRFAVLLLAVPLFLTACGEDDADETTTPNFGTGEPTHIAGMTATAEHESNGDDVAENAETDSETNEAPAQEQEAEPTTPTNQQVRLTAEQLQEIRPNELGWIPVLQYHYFGPAPNELTRTPDQFRSDLQWLYDNNFYVINVRDYLDNQMDVPAGKRPVMLTFDDSSVNQFSLSRLEDGRYIMDPDCAVAIMENFFTANPDFGRGGHFAILPDRAFSWPDAWDQQELIGMKLQWLLDNGYELGNHTLDHENLSLIETPEIQYQLVAPEQLTREYIPGIRLEIVTLPYGGYPHGGDDSIFSGFHYDGEFWTYDAVFLVGANPAFAPVSTEYHPFWIPRIQMFDEEWGRWREFIEENPDIMYVSDGNLDIVTIPNELSWALAGTFDESKLNGLEVVRY